MHAQGVLAAESAGGSLATRFGRAAWGLLNRKAPA
jgi:hypothetical protein